MKKIFSKSTILNIKATRLNSAGDMSEPCILPPAMCASEGLFIDIKWI